MRPHLVIPVLVAPILASCTAARENVMANVQSVIGLSIAQNSQTQAYEAKAGYVRSQIYSVPTGKLVENEAGRPLSDIRNKADVVPDVVGALVVESGVDQLFIGMNVKELFAVGPKAVGSSAAIAMFAGNAATPAHTVAAIRAVDSIRTVEQDLDEADGQSIPDVDSEL